MSQAPYFGGDLCQLTVTAAFLFVAFIFSVFSSVSGLSLAIGSEVAIADIKVKVVLSLSTLLLCFIGTVIGCNQVRDRWHLAGLFFPSPLHFFPLFFWSQLTPCSTPHPHAAVLLILLYTLKNCPYSQLGNYYNNQNNQFISIDTAPKYVFQAGFSCTIAGVLLAFFAAVIDIVASRQKDSVTGKLPPTFRSSPSHIEYHGDHHMERGGYQVTTSPMAQLSYGGSPTRLQIQNVAPPGL